MGIPGVLKEIGKGERVALAKLAVEHLEKTKRPLRIAIDAAIWSFQTQASQGGKNPALRTFYYRLLKLLALPIHPVFVYDGRNKPLVKRGRIVTRWGSCVESEVSKKLVQAFRFPHHTAPGEAEAECALLQRTGIVDMVMSQDGDAIMFGSTRTLRDWSKEGTRGNKTPTHVNLLDLQTIKERTALDPDGMILIALLSGGDYDQNGVAGFGPGLACEVARAGFGSDLLETLRNNDLKGLKEWRERLQFELETNESGYFKKKHKAVKIPDTFPDRTVVVYYTDPVVTEQGDLEKLEKRISKSWDGEIDITQLRQYVGETFDWRYKPGAWKFVRGLAPPLLAMKLRRGLASQYITSLDQIKERRQHFVSDGIPELRVAVVPSAVVGLDLDAEKDSPEYLSRLNEENENEVDIDFMDPPPTQPEGSDDIATSQSTGRQKKSPPWNPNVPEKMWISETVMQLGVPDLVEEWQQVQRDQLADPVKFATRNCNKTRKGKETRNRAIDHYFGPSKSTARLSQPGERSDYSSEALPGQVNVPMGNAPKTPIKRSAVSQVEAGSPTLDHFFKPFKAVVAQEVAKNNRETGHAPHKPADSRIIDGSSVKTSIVLSSSPVAEVEDIRNSSQSSPITPGKIRRSEETIPSESSELPPSVTRRKRKQAKAKMSVEPLKEQLVSVQQPRVIESFFQNAQSTRRQVQRQDVRCTTENEPELPSDLCTGLQIQFVPKHTYALPRDSLPGTWREVELEDENFDLQVKTCATDQPR